MSSQPVWSIAFGPDGMAHALYTELLNLQAIGRLQIRRATLIEFNNAMQQWEVCDADGGPSLYCSPSREECLLWEQEYYNQTAEAGKEMSENAVYT